MLMMIVSVVVVFVTVSVFVVDYVVVDYVVVDADCVMDSINQLHKEDNVVKLYWNGMVIVKLIAG